MLIFTNNAISPLFQSVTATDNVIYVDPARSILFPNPTHEEDYFLITLETADFSRHEIIKITSRTGNALHVGQRGYEGTLAQNWAVEDTICDHRATAGTLTAFLQHTSKRDYEIGASQSFDVDTVALEIDKNKSIKWQVLLNCPDEVLTMSFELHALVKYSTGVVKWTKNAILGDTIKVNINISIVGSNVKLTFENNETSPVAVDFIRVST